MHHAVERRQLYVPRFVRKKKVKWMNRPIQIPSVARLFGEQYNQQDRYYNKKDNDSS